MCKQVYLTFTSCACQLRYGPAVQCAAARASPEGCRGPKPVLLAPKVSSCHYHHEVDQRVASAQFERLCPSSGRHITQGLGGDDLVKKELQAALQVVGGKAWWNP